MTLALAIFGIAILAGWPVFMLWVFWEVLTFEMQLAKDKVALQLPKKVKVPELGA